LRSLRALPAEEEVPVCPIHHSHRCGCFEAAGLPTIAFALAACLALGCASGTSDDSGGFADPDAGCTTPGCGFVDSGFYYAPETGTMMSPETASPFPDSATPGTDALGPTADTRPPPPACTLAMRTGIAACDACLAASCCSADDACGTHPACMAFDMCLATCAGEIPDAAIPDAADVDSGLDGGVVACEDACETEYPEGSSLLNALDTCLETTCATDCGALL
jgi:hypothetical protein